MTSRCGLALLRTMRDMATWFCDAYASWQKGGVENANGRLRPHIDIDRMPDGGAIGLDVLVQPQPRGRLRQHRGERSLANIERLAPQVIAVKLDQVEGVWRKMAGESGFWVSAGVSQCRALRGEGPCLLRIFRRRRAGRE